MKKDIYKYYAFLALHNLLFFLPVAIIYFKDMGLSMTEVFVLFAASGVGFVVFEVPTGAIADYFGKKISVLAGLLTMFLSCTAFFLSTNFIMFLISFLLWALGSTMISGAGVALLYDILDTYNQTGAFKKIRANTKIVSLVSLSVAGILGGVIASYSLRMTYLASAIAFLLCFLVFLSISHKEKDGNEKGSYTKIIKESFSIIRTTKIILILSIFIGIFISVIKLVRPASQLYFEMSGLPLSWFGIAGAYAFAVRAVTARKIDFFDRLLGKQAYTVASIFMIAGLFLISFFTFKAGFLLFGLVVFAAPIVTTFVEHETLKATPKNRHSTVLSFQALLMRGMGVIAAPIFGYALDLIGFSATILWLAIILSIALPIFMLSYRQLHALKPHPHQ
jgi:MFS family permease